MTSFSDITTISVGGQISTFLEIYSEEELISTLERIDHNFFLIGYGSNTLVSDNEFRGTVLRPQFNTISILGESRDEVILRIGAGALFSSVAEYAIENDFQGLEALIGIPGTIGAAPIQNIGAYGAELADVFSSARVYNRENGEIETLTHADMQFGYRTSILKQFRDQYCNPFKIVLSVDLRLSKSKTNNNLNPQLKSVLLKRLGYANLEKLPILQIAENILEIRAEKGTIIDPNQRVGYLVNEQQGEYMQSEYTPNGFNLRPPSFALYDRWSCGSFFINPTVTREKAETFSETAPKFPVGNDQIKLSAAYLISHSGFNPGYSLGNGSKAAISNLNTLAITNRGGATFNQIMDLKDKITQEVFSIFGIRLIPEVNIITN